MNVSYKWLSQLVDLTKYTVDEVADKLTNSGFEVEHVEKLCTATNLVVGEVLECIDHPNSDHLHITKVNVGKEILQIVCGAPNVKANIKVIVALEGAQLPQMTIKKGVVRDIESNGMICSLLELGISEKQLRQDQIEGIEILSDDAPIGMDALAYLGLDDAILDVSLTPNRADCLSMFNMAIETAACLNTTVKLPKINGIKGTTTQVKVGSTTDKCLMFVGQKINNIKLGESPKWIKDILIANDIKCINNVVDISNLVMLETGQPLHFYDADKLEKLELICSDNYNGTYKALDGIDYSLNEKDLVIMSNNKVVGIAGIMGGDDSKITQYTKNILVESANFALENIRLTSRRLNLMTDAASRFSKGIS
ncbi:MAG: phenylalanine--tRNA ligase subunit beta, partial [Erysipelotrichaceae bacterium]